MTQKRLRVAVLFGGRSGEHEVSIASARSVMAAMDPQRYEAVPVGITRTGRWITAGDPLALLGGEGGEGLQSLPSGSGTQSAGSPTSGDGSAGALTACEQRELVPGASAKFPAVDVVFPVLHGTYGEDGTVQGLLELAALPYVGAGVLGSALGMDKIATKAVLRAHGLPVVEHVGLTRSRWEREPEGVIAEVEERFVYPVFVKPANLGSSVGVSKAHDREELHQGLNLAGRFDRRLLVERAVNARELECSVLGNDAPVVSVVGEVLPSSEFYDYRAKYVDDASGLVIPAEVPPAVANRVQQLAVEAFRLLDCAGMARADFFLCRDTAEVYVNELNTIPGFTAISMYPKLWAASGLSYPALIDRLIELALERHAVRSGLETTYGYDH